LKPVQFEEERGSTSVPSSSAGPFQGTAPLAFCWRLCSALLSAAWLLCFDHYCRFRRLGGMNPKLLFDQWTKEFEERLSTEELNLPIEDIEKMLGNYLVEKANQRLAIDPEFREAIEKISLLEIANEVFLKHGTVPEAGKPILKTKANGKNGEKSRGN
jgi:hypothetical protein